MEHKDRAYTEYGNVQYVTIIKARVLNVSVSAFSLSLLKSWRE